MKFTLTCILFCALHVLGNAVELPNNASNFIIEPSSNANKIIGGSEAPNNIYLYLVSLRHTANDRHFCGGTIISKNWVLTSANCVLGVKAANIMIVAGTDSLSSGGTGYGIDETVINPGFNTQTNENDIALVRVKYPIVYGPNVAPIVLAKTVPADNSQGYAVGWGITSYPSDSFPDKLRDLDMRVVSLESCRTIWPILSSQMLCTYKNTESGMCLGDSGGALIVNNQLVGVLSTGIPCARGAPDMFTNVARFYHWIQSSTGIV